MNSREMKAHYKKWIFLTLSILWLGVIYGFSLQSAEESGDTSRDFGKMLVKLVAPGLSDKLNDMDEAQYEQWDHVIRKCAHFTEYLILGILIILTLYQMPVRQKLWLGIGLCCLAAAVDETIQLYVPGRAGRFYDVMLDSLGAFTGICLVQLFIYIRKLKMRE